MDALIGMRLWLSPSPFRLRPAWAAVAGMVAAGVVPTERTTTVVLLLTLLLVDALWGAMVGGLSAVETAVIHGEPAGRGIEVRAVLPWMQRGSPADAFLRWLDGPTARHWGGRLVALAGALLLASILGSWAVRLTLLAGLLAGLTIGMPVASLPNRLVGSVLTVTLPMAAGAFASGGWDRDILWIALPVTLLMAFAYPSPWRVGVLLSQGVLVGLLIVVRQPLAAAGMALLLLPTTLWTLGGVREEDGGRWKALTGPWWLAAMWLASWAMH